MLQLLETRVNKGGKTEGCDDFFLTLFKKRKKMCFSLPGSWQKLSHSDLSQQHHVECL